MDLLDKSLSLLFVVLTPVTVGVFLLPAKMLKMPRMLPLTNIQLLEYNVDVFYGPTYFRNETVWLKTEGRRTRTT